MRIFPERRNKIARKVRTRSRFYNILVHTNEKNKSWNDTYTYIQLYGYVYYFHSFVVADISRENDFLRPKARGEILIFRYRDV